MRKTNRQSRRQLMAISLAVLTGSSARHLLAQTYIFEQNADGQAYSYTAPNGAMINGNFPSDNNWSQSVTFGTYNYSVGSTTESYPYEDAPANWNMSSYPNSPSDNVIIPGLLTTLDVSVSIGNLTINSSGGVNMLAGTTLNIAGNVVDDGSILINSNNGNANAVLNIGGGTVSGSGTFILNHGGYGQLDGSFTQSAGHTIDGFGIVNAALINNGLVDANSNGNTITLQTSNMTNNATFEATGGGTLSINSITVDQSGGGLTSANASTVTLVNTTISAGTVSSAGGGVVVINGSSTFNALTNTASVDIPSNNTLNITGNLVDNGTILINSDNGNANAILNISGGTVSGTGTFILNHGGYGQINGSLTQSAGHTIDGFGIINAVLTNNGLVNANVNGQTLYVEAPSLVNNSLLESTNGATLYFDSLVAVNNAGGAINASSGGISLTNGTSITGGTLSSVSSNVFTVFNYNGSAGYSANLTNLTLSAGSQINLHSGSVLSINGPTFTDNGTIVVNYDNGNSEALVQFNSNTLLTGNGTIYLQHGSYSVVGTAPGITLTQDVNHTIDGVGQLTASLINNGTVDANSGGNTLELLTSNMSNNATFEATSGGYLTINGISVTQGAVGTINAGTGSIVELTNANIINGTLTSAPNTANSSSPSNAGNFYVYGVSSLSNVSNSAYINIPNNNTLNIIGNLVDNGTILVNSDNGNNSTILNVSGGTVSGSGTFILNHGGSYGQLNGVLTQSAGHTIDGFGEINAVLTNNGLVNANVNGQTLYVEAPSLINNSLLESTNGATLYFDSLVAVNNAAGAINASSGGISLTNGASITGGTLNSVSPNVFTVFNYNGSAGYSANLTALNLSAGSQINLRSGNTLSINGPTFTDNGTIVVNYDNGNNEALVQFNSNTLLTGNGSIYLQHGVYSVVGTAPGVTLTQGLNHTIDGVGQVTASLINNGTVDANSGGNTLELLNSNMSNSGTFEATGGGTLNINGITVTQSGAGLTTANASTVTLVNATLSGGTLSSPAGGVVYADGSSTFNALTSTASVDIISNNTLNITGNLVDNGTILINSDNGNNNAVLNISGGTVSGSGTFILNHGGYGQINGSLTQSAGHTIDGFGVVNAALVNNGLVDANSGGNAITLQTSNMSNNTTFEATAGGTLAINGISVTQGAAGMLNASTSSAVTLTNANVISGTLTSAPNTANSSSPSNAGNFYVYGVSSLSNVSNSAYINLPAGNTLNIVGNLVDNGTILINSNNNNNSTILNVSGGTVSGSGTFILNHGGSYGQLNGVLTQSAGHTIDGFGTINAILTNNGLVNANVNGQTLYVEAPSLINNSLLESTNGATLYFDSLVAVNNAAGAINASSGGISLTNGASITGGTLNSVSPNVFTVFNYNGSAGYTANLTNLNLSAGSQINLHSGNTLSINGPTFTDNGTIVVNYDNGNSEALVQFNSNTLLAGNGSIYLQHGSYSVVGTAPGVTLTQGVNHTIDGLGQVTASLINNGTVDANSGGNTLELLNSNMSNSGTFEATGNGFLTINGITVTQSGAGLTTANASTVTLVNATLSGGTLSSPGGGVVNINGSSTFNALTSSASVNIPSNNTLNITGNLVDNGTILINSDNGNNNAILNSSGGTVSGTGTFILNHGGFGQLNGSLTQSAGHTIDGFGTINAALTNNGLVDANSNGNAITLQTSNMSNSGTIEATSGGHLTINGITVTQTGAGLTSANASTVTLVSATLSGGTLSSPGGGVVNINGSSTFNALTSSASVNIPSNNTLNITGNVVDDGTVLINSDNGNGNAIVNSSGGTVSGTGTFILNHGGFGQINGSLTQSAGHTIDGFGVVNATLVNNGLVNANVNGQTLYLEGTSTGSGTFQASNGATLDVGGSVSIGAAGALIGAGAGSPIVINGGASVIDNGATGGLPAIVDNGSLTFGANPNAGIEVHSLTSLSIGSGATATINNASNISNRTLLVTSALTIAGNSNNWAGLLNLGNNDMDVAGASLATVTNQIAEGFNGGNWQGAAGITSSAAAVATSHLFALGVIQNNQGGTPIYTSGNPFDGTLPGASDILVKYTYYGDANLDGKVDASDYSRIDNGYLNHLTGWFNGDFNYDGVVNGSDYTLIDNAFNLQGAALTAEVVSPTAEIATAASDVSVPEPASFALLAIASSGLLARRRPKPTLTARSVLHKCL